MARFNKIIICIILLTFYTLECLGGYVKTLPIKIHTNQRKRRDTDADITQRIAYVGTLPFNMSVSEQSGRLLNIRCLFVFDAEASQALNNNFDLAQSYASKLAELGSKYTKHANINIINAGVEMWSTGDKIQPAAGSVQYIYMPNLLKNFQDYLAQNKASLFGSQYAIGILVSGKSLVSGGFSQGPPCTTSGASLINFKPYPWSIGGLVAHELAHTFGVIHPNELIYLCQSPGRPNYSFCPPNAADIPSECQCNSAQLPPQQCLMTYQFGKATGIAAQYTRCDLELIKNGAKDLTCPAAN